MTLKEIPKSEPEQLTFKAFELAETVAELLDLEFRKKEANEEFNIQIKALKKHIGKLSFEIQADKKAAA